MKWLIVGAGAIGGYFGGRVAEIGRDVTFLVHAGRQQQLREHGLVIASPSGKVHIRQPQTVLANGLTTRHDVIVVACKAYALEQAMEDFAPAVGPGTLILPLLNGMSHIDALCARFGAEHVLGGMCIISSALAADGTVRHLNDTHRLVYGELDGTRSERTAAVAHELDGIRCTTELSVGIQQEMWEKWVLIATVAGSTCLMRAAICDIVEAGAQDIITTLFAECCAIAAENGHAPRPAALERMRAFSTNAHSTLTASMLKDMERGAPIEGEHIISELIARADLKKSHLRLLPLVRAHLRSYEARRRREAH